MRGEDRRRWQHEEVWNGREGIRGRDEMKEKQYRADESASKVCVSKEDVLRAVFQR